MKTAQKFLGAVTVGVVSGLIVAYIQSRGVPMGAGKKMQRGAL